MDDPEESLVRCEGILAQYLDALTTHVPEQQSSYLYPLTRDIRLSFAEIRRILEPKDKAYINKLPEELLVTIFRLLQPPRHDPGLGIHTGELLCPQTPSSLFTHVCRRWRSVVLAAPLFWSMLCIQLDMEGNHVDRIKSYFNRSVGCGGLTLHIQFPEPPRNDDDDDFEVDAFPERPSLDFTVAEQVFTVLLDYTRLWRSLFVEAECNIQRDWVAQTLRNASVPVLERFHIWETDSPWLEVDDTVISRDLFLSGAPNLRRISFAGSVRLLGALPLGAVTHIEIGETHHNMWNGSRVLRVLLGAAPSLTHLTFSENDSHLGTLGPVFSRSLRYLKVCVSQKALVEGIRAPALTELIYDAEHELDAFLSLLRFARAPGPFPALQTLKLSGDCWSKDLPLDALIEKLPRIKHATFDVSSSSGSTDVMPGIEAIMDGWPNLRTFHASGIDKTVLLSFVESRMGTPFHTLEFAEGFVKILKREYPQVVTRLKERGIWIEQSNHDPWGCRWAGYLKSWEDGSHESVFGSFALR